MSFASRLTEMFGTRGTREEYVGRHRELRPEPRYERYVAVAPVQAGTAAGSAGARTGGRDE